MVYNDFWIKEVTPPLGHLNLKHKVSGQVAMKNDKRFLSLNNDRTKTAFKTPDEHHIRAG